MKKKIERLLELVYPQDIYCMSCGRPINRGSLYSFCEDCLSSLIWANKKLCQKCGKLLEDWYPDPLCGECKNKVRAFDRGITCVQYGDRERELIRELKYHGKAYMARSLAEIMKDRLKIHIELSEASKDSVSDQIVVPVPMYKKKEKKRGYNQAALLGKYLAKSLNIQYSETVLFRVRDTEPMNSLTGKQREENLIGAFHVDKQGAEQVSGKMVILVDDIYTTGTTANHCSSILKGAGAKEVLLFSFASGRNQRPLPELNQQ